VVAGGVAYSIGAVIYALKKPNPLPGKFGFHEIFHLWIIAGAAIHFGVVLAAVI
jgi:hemolysin III